MIGRIILFAAVTLVAAMSFGATIHVPSQHPTIQAGINAASNSDTVLVADGTYTGVGNRDIDFAGKKIVVRSENGAAVTIIDCQGSSGDPHRGFNFHSHEDTTCKVEGLTIRGGFGLSDTPGGFTVGGGIRCDTSSSPTIRDCIIDGNTAQIGGGVYSGKGSYPRIRNCDIRRNSGQFGGGAGVMSANLYLYHSTVDSNVADSGGGVAGYYLMIYARGSSVRGNAATSGGGGGLCLTLGSIILDSCEISRNRALTQSTGEGGGAKLRQIGYLWTSAIHACTFFGDSAYFGGGLSLDTTSAVQITQSRFDSSYSTTQGGGLAFSGSARIASCVFEGNLAGNTDFGHGGGIRCYGGSPAIDSCDFIGNWAKSDGGGVNVISGASPSVTDCRFLDNESDDVGGGMSCIASSPSISRCLFAGNKGGAIAALSVSNPSIEQCTMFDNYCGGTAAADLFVGMNCAPIIRTSNFTFGRQSPSVYCSGPGSNPTILDCNIYGNTSGNWVGCIAGQYPLYGNTSTDPLFCDTAGRDFHLLARSPLTSQNSSSGLTIGAFDAGCYDTLMIKQVFFEGEPSIQHIRANYPVIGWEKFACPSYTQANFEIGIGDDENWSIAELWNPAPFSTSDTFVTYAGAALVDGQTYYLRLRVSDGMSWSNWYHSSFRMNTSPTTPVPCAPDWPDITVSTTPDLSVVNSSDAESDWLTYDFEIFRDSVLTQLAVASPHIPEMHQPESTTWTVTPPLDDNKMYYWHVRAFDGYEYSAWSYMRFFIANNANEPPNPFTLLDPPDSTGPISYNRKPTFRWTYTGDPDPYNQVRYKLEMAVDPAFQSLQVIDSLYTSFWIPPDSLPYHSHYWWRVSAIDQYDGTTPGTNIKEFWTWTLGDVDHSNNVDISDLTRLIDYLYISFGPIVPRKVGDLDGDCTVDISDLTRLIDYLYITFTPLTVGGCGP